MRTIFLCVSHKKCEYKLAQINDEGIYNFWEAPGAHHATEVAARAAADKSGMAHEMRQAVETLAKAGMAAAQILGRLTVDAQSSAASAAALGQLPSLEQCRREHLPPDPPPHARMRCAIAPVIFPCARVFSSPTHVFSPFAASPRALSSRTQVQ